jgi:hypothetical protein
MFFSVDSAEQKRQNVSYVEVNVSYVEVNVSYVEVNLVESEVWSSPEGERCVKTETEGASTNVLQLF